MTLLRELRADRWMIVLCMVHAFTLMGIVVGDPTMYIVENTERRASSSRHLSGDGTCR